MDVEIDHRDAPQPMLFSRLLDADGDIVEHAKSHGAGRCRVVTRRPHGAERVPRLAGDDGIDRRANGAGGAHEGRGRGPGDDRIRRDMRGLGGFDGVEHLGDITRRMNPRDLPALGGGRLAAVERVELGIVEAR